jgi:pyridoxal phosphate enzyme (YggS family)
MSTPFEHEHAGIAGNLQRVLERIAAAAQRCGRASNEIKLIGVSKYVDIAATRALFAAGCVDLAESRPQQLWEKVSALSDLPARWHLIGHLQRNKVNRTVACGALLQSIDSQRLAESVQQAAEQQGVEVTGLLEVNTSGDQAKHGVAVPDAPRLLATIEQGCDRLRIVGLMTMASLTGGPEQARRDFEQLRALRDRLAPDHPRLRELSMGMSGDFEQAIAAGATMVRIGSALFE